MSGLVALLCLCVLFVLSVSPNVLGQDDDHRPSAETGQQYWSRILEVGQARLDERGRGGQQANCGVIEPQTSCDPRTSVLQSQIVAEQFRAFSDQLTRCNLCNERLDAAQQKIESYYKESHYNKESHTVESLRAENLQLKLQLEKTQARCDLEVTVLTAKVQELSGDVARLRESEETRKGKLAYQTSDLQQQMFDQILNSTEKILQESAKLGQDLVNVNSGVKETILQSASDSNITLAVIKKDLIMKSDEILVQISASKTKVEEGFDKMTTERNSNFTALQTKNEATLKIIETTEKLVKFVAATAAAKDLIFLGVKFYHFSNQTHMSWHAARDFCVSRGLTLATVESAGEHQRVLDHVKKFGMGGTWLGASDEDEEGTWRWTGTGATSTYTKWWSGQPGGGTVENCVYSDSNWHDYPCTGTFPFICELQI